MTIDIDSGKPKTSTVDKMSKEDLSLVDKLVGLCGQYYYDISHPSKPGPHRNPESLDNLKSLILTMSLRVGERVWFPRGENRHFKELKAKVDKYGGELGKQRNKKSKILKDD